MPLFHLHLYSLSSLIDDLPKNEIKAREKAEKALIRIEKAMGLYNS